MAKITKSESVVESKNDANRERYFLVQERTGLSSNEH